MEVLYQGDEGGGVIAFLPIRFLRSNCLANLAYWDWSCSLYKCQTTYTNDFHDYQNLFHDNVR